MLWREQSPNLVWARPDPGLVQIHQDLLHWLICVNDAIDA